MCSAQGVRNTQEIGCGTKGYFVEDVAGLLGGEPRLQWPSHLPKLARYPYYCEGWPRSAAQPALDLAGSPRLLCSGPPASASQVLRL